MKVSDDSWPKTPFGEFTSPAAYMAYVERVMLKSAEYNNWINPPESDEWYPPEEFYKEFGDWHPGYHIFFNQCRQKKPDEIICELISDYQSEYDRFSVFISKIADYYSPDDNQHFRYGSPDSVQGSF